VAELLVAIAWLVVLGHNAVLAVRGVGRRLGPARWLAGIAAVAVALVAGAHLERTGGGPLSEPPLATAIGLAGAGGGAALHLWARRTIGAAWSAVAQPAALVEDGPYGVVRHPIYLGLAAMVVGTVLVRPSLATAAGAVGALASLVGKMVTEERALARAFGARWRDYCARVPRVVPRLRGT
jgi:protein-S-isoprenylcysteine O-methyltransferase Ste14